MVCPSRRPIESSTNPSSPRLLQHLCRLGQSKEAYRDSDGLGESIYEVIGVIFDVFEEFLGSGHVESWRSTRKTQPFQATRVGKLPPPYKRLGCRYITSHAQDHELSLSTDIRIPYEFGPPRPSSSSGLFVFDLPAPRLLLRAHDYPLLRLSSFIAIAID